MIRYIHKKRPVDALLFPGDSLVYVDNIPNRPICVNCGNDRYFLSTRLDNIPYRTSMNNGKLTLTPFLDHSNYSILSNDGLDNFMSGAPICGYCEGPLSMHKAMAFEICRGNVADGVHDELEYCAGCLACENELGADILIECCSYSHKIGLCHPFVEDGCVGCMFRYSRICNNITVEDVVRYTEDKDEVKR